jgi:hypothetical protein
MPRSLIFECEELLQMFRTEIAWPDLDFKRYNIRQQSDEVHEDICVYIPSVDHKFAYPGFRTVVGICLGYGSSDTPAEQGKLVSVSDADIAVYEGEWYGGGGDGEGKRDDCSGQVLWVDAAEDGRVEFWRKGSKGHSSAADKYRLLSG